MRIIAVGGAGTIGKAVAELLSDASTPSQISDGGSFTVANGGVEGFVTRAEPP